MKVYNERLFDSSGRPIGTVSSRRRPLNDYERHYCRTFLEKIVAPFQSERKKENMKTAVPKKETIEGKAIALANEECNMVFVAGKIKMNNVRDRSAWTLVEFEKGSIPITTFDRKIMRDLENFENGDFIRFVGRLSQTKNDDGKYQLIVVSTQIKCEIPKRERKRENTQEDIPF